MIESSLSPCCWCFLAWILQYCLTAEHLVAAGEPNIRGSTGKNQYGSSSSNEGPRQGQRNQAQSEQGASPSSSSTMPVASMTVPLHSHSGSHHVYIHAGSPVPQRQTLIFDTGSRYMAFPCAPSCTPPKCGTHASPYFDVTQSTTLVRNGNGNNKVTRNNETNDDNDTSNNGSTQSKCVYAKKETKSSNNNSTECIFRLTYMEGSQWTAVEVEDVLWLTTGHDYEESMEEFMPHLAIPFTFGCQTSVTGHFQQQYADGILGFAFAKQENAFLNTMVRAGAINRRAFATCMTRQGGTLSLGGSGLVSGGQTRIGQPSLEQAPRDQYHLEPMFFTSIIEENGYYSMPLKQVMLGDECITCDYDDDINVSEQQKEVRRSVLDSFRSGKGVILDSGTTDTYFNKASLPVFADVWSQQTGMKLQYRQTYTYEQFRKMPDVTFQFEPNATLTIPPHAYMEGVPMMQTAALNSSNVTTTSIPKTVKPWTGYRQLFLRIYFDDPTGAVLGINAMYNYDILYDLQDNRIGLARSHCGP